MTMNIPSDSLSYIYLKYKVSEKKTAHEAATGISKLGLLLMP